MQGSRRTLVAAVCAVFMAFGAASAGDRRVPAPFNCVETQAPKKTLYWDVDDQGDPIRIASYEQVGRFSGTVKLAMDDLGKDFKRLNPAARFNVSIGNAQFAGRLSDSNYVQGRPSATFDIVPGDMDPDTGLVGPAWVKARVSWTRKRVTVVVTGRQSVLLPEPDQQNETIDVETPMSVAFYGVSADLDVHVTGTVRNRSIVDGFGVQIPLTNVKLRGAGVVHTP
jgi:hypothetical protein